MLRTLSSFSISSAKPLLLAAMILLALTAPVMAQPEHKAGGEANLVLPDLNSATFFGDAVGGHDLLMVGLIVCALGLGFGLMMYSRLKNMPVHKSMLEVSELIYSTCKTYLETQGKFLLILEIFIGAIILGMMALHSVIERRSHSGG